MNVTQHTVDASGALSPPVTGPAELCLVFFNRKLAEVHDVLPAIRAAWPGAKLAGCTTSGQIHDVSILDGVAVVTAIHFDDAGVEVVTEPLTDAGDSFEVGATLGDRLASPTPPQAVIVFSEGLAVNGSTLVRGLSSRLPVETLVAGGLAADDGDFQRTCVLVDGALRTNFVTAVGLWGDKLHVSCGSLGGFEPFGPERVVSRSEGNDLFMLDNEPALDLYKRFLGEWADELPAAGLRFPLSIRTADGRRFVRTVLGVDETTGSMRFAGDVPQGAMARLMTANLERLIDGAEGAASNSLDALGAEADLALLVSCVGRRLVLRARTEDELEAVRSVLGARPAITGFYSYGELAPFAAGRCSELHNQTMTMMLIGEG